MSSDSIVTKRWTFAAAAASGAFSIWYVLRYLRWRARVPPNGPGVVERLKALAGFSHKQVEWAELYGPIFRTWDPLFGTSIHVTDPDIMYDITVRVGNFYRNPCSYGRSPAFGNLVADVMGTSVTGLVGDEWRWRKDSLVRQFANSTLLAPERGILEAIMHEGELLCASLGKVADDRQVVRVDELTTHAATGVMLFLMYGKRPEFDECALREGSKNLMTVLKGLFTPGLTKKRLKELRDLQAVSQEVFDVIARPELQAILEEIKTGTNGQNRKPCMMEALLKSEPRYSKSGLDGLLAEARVFVNAGYETTAHSLSFTFGLLAEPRNAAIAEQAQKEAAKAVTDGLKRETLMDSTAYLDKVFHESLRLFPLAPNLGGQAYDDFNITVGAKEYLIPKGAVLNFHNISGQRCARVWPDPERCNPEHWSTDASRKRLMTFNLGAHACPGKTLSHLEARVFMAMVLSRFRFELPTGVEKVEAYEELLYRPKDGMPLRVFRL